jgi:feruloyl esterase
MRQRCESIATLMQGAWPEASTRIESAVFRPAGPMDAPAGQGPAAAEPLILPAHCDLVGRMQERTGIDGQPYAIRFHLRLPAEWNGRFFMQGGGGTNGNLGDAVGDTGGNQPALAQGYAVLSQDSGHDNAVNSSPERGGATSFGLDPLARANYGHASLPLSVGAAKAGIAQFYGDGPSLSYFFGCSKGGQEGMVLAQRYPALFDGIVAAAPGMSLPRAAIAEAWDTQSFALAAEKPLTPASLAASFSDADLHLVREAVLDACDAQDGLADGIVSDFPACTSATVLPALSARTCTGDKQEGCLSAAQITALKRVQEGPRNLPGEALYKAFPWDAGWSDAGWRIWKIGAANGGIPSLNVAMGAPALAQVFTVPPANPGSGLQGALAYAMQFDFNRDAPAIYARSAAFPRPAWEDIGARSPDIAAYAARGGKLIVPHGVSDPAFSVADTTSWWEEVNRRMSGRAAQTVRVFPIPGMGHCRGGPATDQYDAFGALVDWVERGDAPERLLATAGPNSPWPGRSRPLCPWPQIAHYKGQGDTSAAESFTCTAP